MPTHPRPSPEPHPFKRQRQSSPDKESPNSIPGVPSPVTETSQDGHISKIGQSSSFRNVSACNRCRLRKNRCDQKLPSCASCEKAGVACVGYDPITKREIPRRCGRISLAGGGLTQKRYLPPPPSSLFTSLSIACSHVAVLTIL